MRYKEFLLEYSREKTLANDLIMQWIDKNAAKFRQDIIAGKFDSTVEKFL